MSQNERKQNSNERLTAVLFLFLLGMIGFFLLKSIQPASKPAQPSHSETSMSSTAPTFNTEEDRIDQYLKESYQKQHMQQLQTELANKAMAPEINATEIDELAYVDLTHESDTLNLENENTFENVTKDIKEAQKTYEVQSAEQDIQRRVKINRANADYDRQFVQEYVRQYKQNAKNAGYAVNVDKNLQVIGVRPTSRPDQPLRIPQSSSDAAQ